MRLVHTLLVSLMLLPTAAFACGKHAVQEHNSTHAAKPCPMKCCKKQCTKKQCKMTCDKQCKKQCTDKQCHMHGSDSSAAYEQVMEKMHSAMMVPYTGDADIDFVQGMIPHHQGAVDMANVELKYGKSPEMKALAAYIIRWQETEIGFMKSWLNGRKSGFIRQDAALRPSSKAYMDAMNHMHHAMMIDYTGDADADFARGMIPHHQGAIDMAWILKEYGKQQELRPMMDGIIRSQGQEIGIMQDWLKTHATETNTDTKKEYEHGNHASH